MSRIQPSRPEKKAKNYLKLSQKLSWESWSTTHLPFPSSNFKILKAFPKTLPIEKKNLLNAQHKKSKIKARKEKEEGRRERKKKSKCSTCKQLCEKCYLFIARQLTLSKFIKMTDKEHRKGPIFHLMLGQ